MKVNSGKVMFAVARAFAVISAKDALLVVKDLLRGRRRPMVVHYNRKWVPDPIVAICLGRNVFTKHPFLSQWVLDHEEQHVIQYERYGFLGLLARWFWSTLRDGYARNRYELEADDYADVRGGRSGRQAVRNQRVVLAIGKSAQVRGEEGSTVSVASRSSVVEQFIAALTKETQESASRLAAEYGVAAKVLVISGDAGEVDEKLGQIRAIVAA